MALRTYFKGKTGKVFWLNIAIMVIIIVAMPFITLYMLNIFTHHGEKIEVPSVVGMSAYDAEDMLTEHDLVFVINDSAYNKHAAPGSVLDQMPKPGTEVKGGRVVYVTVNLKGEPTVTMPAISSSLRETMATLSTLGFRFTKNQVVFGMEKDRVIEVKQGIRTLHEGELITRDRPLTIVVGGGEPVDTLRYYQEEEEEVENDFDIEL